MPPWKYLCNQCKALFELPVPPGSAEEKEARCPECGSMHIEVLPSWVPIGFNLYEGPTDWEYACQQCKTVFRLPVPRGPSEEKEAKCPECGSMHIERLTAIVVEHSPYCG